MAGDSFPIIVTHGRWSLISSINILLVICPVSLDSKNMLSISIAVLWVMWVGRVGRVGRVITGNKSLSRL